MSGFFSCQRNEKTAYVWKDENDLFRFHLQQIV